jgi:hypothetical protein
MYIKEEQTTQWPTEKVQKDKQRSTKHTYKTIDRVTRTSLKTHILIVLFLPFNDISTYRNESKLLSPFPPAISTC